MEELKLSLKSKGRLTKLLNHYKGRKVSLDVTLNDLLEIWLQNEKKDLLVCSIVDKLITPREVSMDISGGTAMEGVYLWNKYQEEKGDDERRITSWYHGVVY